MSVFWWIAILYLGFSTPLTYWCVKADIPKIRAEYGFVHLGGLVFATLCVWVSAPVLFAIYLWRKDA